MPLGPHHFQAQAGFFEQTLNFSTSALWFESYGLVGCELDAEALRNGTVSVVHARGFFPDGLTFHMPECDALPEPRNIAEIFPPTRDRLVVLLAVPEWKPGGANCALNGASPALTRFVAVEKKLSDENSGLDEKIVRIGKKNVRLLLDNEPADGMVTLPLARVMRDGAGGFVYDENFIPPCVQIAASPRLLGLARRLLSILEEKSASLTGAARGVTKLAAGLSPQQVATFWFLHAINSALAPLRHIALSRQGHPEHLYKELLRLGGALCTFGLDSHPRDLPLYNHMDLQECFQEIDRHIRTHLEYIVPTNCVSIPLQPVSKYFWEGDVADSRCFGRARWIFGIHARMGEAELIRLTPQLAKLCSSQFVPELVRRAIPGMQITHLPSPPAAVSPRVDSQYFAVNKAGPCWEHLMQSKRVGVYVPGEIPSPDLELLVVLDS
jgi:type VI secretion system protein ImpJ